MTSRDADVAPPIRVVFLGTPDFAVPTLRALLDDPGLTVPLVVTQPDRPAGRGRQLVAPPVKVVAEEAGVAVFQPERLRGQDVLDRLREADADLFAIAAYGQLLRQAVLDIPRHGCLNVHPSLLPRHRGPSPIPAAILAGDAETGVTIMLTERGMDTGPILTQERVPIGPADTAATLAGRLAPLGGALLVRTIRPWIAGEITPLIQDEAAATPTRQFTREDGALDWTRPALELERQVRALNPWPRAYTFREGKRLLVLNAHEVAGGDARATPGTVLAGPSGALLVATGDGALALDEVQAEGRRAVSGEIYLRGNVGLAGTILAGAAMERGDVAQ